MIPAWLAFIDALAAAALVLAGIVGAHYRFTAPFVGFQIFVPGFFLAILALFVGIVALFVTRKPPRRRARPQAMAGFVLGVVIAIPVVFKIVSTAKYPAINDITTDVNNPPEFVHAEQLRANRGRDMTYNKALYAAAQEQGYGNVEPLALTADPGTVFAQIQALASRMPGWEVTYTDPKTHTLEGVATSSLFHFKDDFVIQVRAAGGGGSLVEMRSKSRDGVGDFGVNYNRIEDFFARLRIENASG